MGDMGDDFNFMKNRSREKRADNREYSAAVLTRSGIVFESKNMDAHLIVLGGAKVIDFWPGTGLWIVRGSKEKRRGVRKLVEFVEAQRLIKKEKQG